MNNTEIKRYEASLEVAEARARKNKVACLYHAGDTSQKERMQDLTEKYNMLNDAFWALPIK